MADTRVSYVLFNASCTSHESYTSMVSALRTADGSVRNAGSPANSPPLPGAGQSQAEGRHPSA